MKSASQCLLHLSVKADVLDTLSLRDSLAANSEICLLHLSVKADVRDKLSLRDQLITVFLLSTVIL